MAELVDPDVNALDDLVTFARIERDSADVEPWAAIIAHLYNSGTLDVEEALWLISLYNCYDSLSSAWQAFRRWPSPHAWATAPDFGDARRYPCTQERRNLHGGKVIRRLESYVAHLAGESQQRWLGSVMALTPRDAAVLPNWYRLIGQTRRVWGVGRQSAFEWVEFIAKVFGWGCAAPNALLWESEGPRRSLQRLYGNPRPSLVWLDARADECRSMLADAGVALSWEDFETIICDFNVMRDGRYYPGRHLAAIREEIDLAAPDDRALLLDAFRSFVPQPWASITPGIRADLRPVYRDTGRIICSPHVNEEVPA